MAVTAIVLALFRKGPPDRYQLAITHRVTTFSWGSQHLKALEDSTTQKITWQICMTNSIRFGSVKSITLSQIKSKRWIRRQTLLFLTVDLNHQLLCPRICLIDFRSGSVSSRCTMTTWSRKMIWDKTLTRLVNNLSTIFVTYQSSKSLHQEKWNSRLFLTKENVVAWKISS